MKHLLKNALILLTALLLLLTCGCRNLSPLIPGGDSSDDASDGTEKLRPDTQEPEDTYQPGSGLPLLYLTSREYRSDRESGDVSADFRKAYAAFALKLLTACEKDKGDTAMVSPLSVMTALAMTANGAKGDTLQQMLDTLGGLSLEELNQQIFNFTASLSSEEDAFFRAANSVWVTSDPDFSIGQSFLKAIENTFRGDVISTNFADNQKASDEINGWCAEMTNGMIRKVIDPSMLSRDTVMALLNALCFEAKWSDPFPTDNCREGTFHGGKGDTTVTMMYGEASRYLEGDSETGFLRYYKGGRYAFMALLPEEGITVDAYLSGLDGEKLISLLDGAKPEEVIIRMPKFKADYDVELNDILQSFGMVLPFDSDHSDLSGLGHTQDESNLYISQVIHKTHIDVDNEGTKAAAVTAVIVNRATSVGPAHEPRRVILDRPFVYGIIDTATGLPIFFGTCENIAA